MDPDLQVHVIIVAMFAAVILDIPTYVADLIHL